MATRKRSHAEERVSKEELLDDAKQAFEQTKKALELELEKVDDYLKALEGWTSFNPK